MTSYSTDNKGEDILKRNLQLRLFWLKIESELSTLKFNNIDNPNFNISQLEEILKSELNAVNANATISDDALYVLSKACEIFILELTMQSWQNIHDDGNHILKVK